MIESYVGYLVIIICLELSVDAGLRVHVLVADDDGVVVIVQDADECPSVLVVRHASSVVNVTSRVAQNLYTERLLNHSSSVTLI